MIKQVVRVNLLAVLGAILVFAGLGVGGANSASKVAPFTNQGFVDAAHDNCAVSQGRTPQSCECERKLVSGDRLTDEDKEMAYYFWLDKKEYGKRFEAKKKTNPEWQKAFASRFNNLQALIISACGK